MTTVLKLGGSVITRKDEPETLDEAAIADAADAIADHSGELVLVHGGGSFGHHHAGARGVTTTEGTRDAAAVVAIHGAMRRLDDAVVGALHDRDAPAVPVHPLSAAARGADGTLEFPTGQVETMLAEGFVPVLHGDVIVHAGSGATILSGDDVVVELARALDARRVGLCSGVPGVLDREGSVIDRIDAFDPVADVLGESDATDVTGGMAAKVRTLLSLEARASIFGPPALRAFLGGDSPGTAIDGTAGDP